MSPAPAPAPRFGPPSRGVTASDVERAADSLLRGGERPTVEKVRAKLGTGSPNTINPLLDAWWKTIGNRLDSGPAALHRLPEPIAHIAEALWLQALDEARRRTAIEHRTTERTLATDQQTLELRSHVLSLREGELDSRLRDRDRTQALLEAQVKELTLQLRKASATTESQARRLATLEAELEARARPIATAKRRAPKESKPKRTRTPKRAVTAKARNKPTAKRPRSKKRR
jgi:hypothetical protein